MKMKTLITDISSLVTVDSKGRLYKKGNQMQEIGEIKDGAVFFDETIIWVGTAGEAAKKIQSGEIIPEKIISAKGKTILPGFCDSHTHIVFAGNRSGEFARRLRGATYQEIAAEGGGILTTMKATRSAGIDELAENGRKLAKSALKYGTTSIEIKSGYGLTTESEINQLKAAEILKNELPMNIKVTFMGAHDFPAEYQNNREKYIDLLIDEMLPKVAEGKLADFCDAFVDKGYYTTEQAERLFKAAEKLGFQIKVHADELADVDAAGLAAKMKAVSADHLLFISDKNIKALAESGTVAALLPSTAYFIRMPYAPARKIIDMGAIAALATDCNPGSSYTENMQLILSLSVINMNMTAEEAISAATINGAYAMRISDKTGSLEIGKQADFIVAGVDSYTDLFYHFGINHIEEVWTKGKNRL